MIEQEIGYERLAEDAAKPRAVHDLSELWNRLTPIEKVGGSAVDQIARFCASKGISTASLTAQDARVATWGRGPDLMLAFPGYGPYRGIQRVTAIKYRNMTTGRRAAEKDSSFGRPNIMGNLFSLDWFVVEGETDAARIWDLVGDEVAIFVLPTGALDIRRSWIGRIPMDATVYAALDADPAGDAGAAKLARMVKRTVRIRPPDGYKDWNMWPGTRDEFVSYVTAAARKKRSSLVTYKEARQQTRSERTGDRPVVHLGFGSIDRDLRGISDGQVCGVAARTAVGKSWLLASIEHNIAGAGIGGLVCSLEMPLSEWAVRSEAIHEGVSTKEIEDRMSGDHPEPTEFYERMKHTLLCQRMLSLEELHDVVLMAKEELSVPLRCVYVDYLGLVGSRGRDVYERTSNVGKGLKDLAKEEQVAIFVAMQLSRAAGDGTSEVSLEMMRDSGVIEESMDFILGCWRKKNCNDMMHVKVIKNRKGIGGRTVDLRFHQPSMKVIEVAG